LVTEEMSEQVLTLPMYPTLTKEEIDFVALEIANFVGG
jgi:dTDP-4-amino-4,6-dideoxygalactose transaminase